MIGIRREHKSPVAIAVFPSGPGDWMIVKEKKPMMRSNKYWKSYSVHRCVCKDLRVSTGEKEVCNLDMDEVGERRLRSLDRSLRRMRCGTRSWNERHGT